MALPLKSDVTEILLNWRSGDQSALDQLLPLVYQELRRLADHFLRREAPGHTLQATALVHEAYLRLVDQSQANWQNRAHFFGVAANLMRQILIQYARAKHADKRGGDQRKIYLDDAGPIAQDRPLDLIALDDALQTLAEISPRQNQIVELRYFGGLSIEETAEVMSLSPATIKREWSMAKAWLFRELAKTELEEKS
jgi:RNA polymerase sigma factor (TIGR02999 family)